MNRNLLKAVTLSLFGAGIFAVACSDAVPPAPRAAVNSLLGQGPSAPQSDCQLATGPVIIMGDPEIPGQSVDNGSFGNINGVDCTVAQSGVAYNVVAHLSVHAKGSITISGTFQPIDKTKPAPQQANTTPITAVWVEADLSGSFRQTDCTAWYTNDLTSPSTSTTLQGNQGVAVGRVWATVFCPRALFVGDQSVHKACQAAAEFKLENCATQ